MQPYEPFVSECKMALVKSQIIIWEKNHFNLFADKYGLILQSEATVVYLQASHRNLINHEIGIE